MKDLSNISKALEDKMTSRNLCQFDFLTEKEARANKQLSIASQSAE